MTSPRGSLDTDDPRTENERRLECFFMHSPIGKCITTPDGGLLRVNVAFGEMLGRSVEELQAVGFSEITHPDDLAESRECVRALLAGEQDVWSMEKRYLHRDGHHLWTHVTTRLQRDEAGAPAFFLTHVQDITARQRAEESLRHLNSVLRAIRNVNQLIVREKDPGRMIEQACEMLVETREYRGAWIAVGPPEGSPTHIAQAGWGDGFEPFRDQLRRGEAPACRARASETGGAVLEPHTACAGCPLREQYGWDQAAVVLLRHGDQVLGTLGVSLPRGVVVDEEERSLLDEVAGDLAFALAAIGTEQQMLDAKAERATLYDQAPVLLLLIDGDRRVRKANRMAMELAGGEGLLGKRGGEALRCVHSLDDPRGCGFGPACAACRVRQVVVDTLERGRDSTQVPVSLHVTGTDGLEREVFFLMSSVSISLGGERLAHVCLLDVTEPTQLQHRYQSLFEHMLNGIAFCRMIYEGGRPVDFVYEAVNPAFGVQTGLAKVCGRRVSEVIPGIRERDPGLFEIYGRVVETGVPERFELFLRSLGQWFEVSVFRPQAEHFVAVFDVVTERKRAEETLRTSEERHRVLFESTRDALITLAPPTWRFTTCNPATLALFGARDVHDFVGRAPTAYAPTTQPDGRGSEEAFRELMAAALRRGSVSFEWRCRRADGAEFPASVQLTRFELGGQVQLLATVHDLTDVARIQEQLLVSQKMESIGRLAGGVAHDFNNLLSVIITYSELVAQELSESDPLLADVVCIREAGERAAALTRQLLAFSRKQLLEPKVLDLNNVVAGIEGMLRRLLGEDIEIAVYPATGLGSVMADPGQVEQVIVNLAINARDAMPGGGKLTIETAEVELDAAYVDQHASVQPGSFVLLSVADTGCGMDATTKARIFEPFFTTKEKGKGTGLGLATVYGIVKQSGGHVWVYSEPGQGTTFKVYLPRIAVAVIEPPTRRESASRMGRERVLIVEDEEAVRKLAERLLRRAGYDVIVAACGDDALEVCERSGRVVDLLLTDVVMPRMSGRALAERLAQVMPRLKVLYMSGYTDNAIVHHGVLDPGTQFLGKPFTAESLTRRVREVLDGGGA